MQKHHKKYWTGVGSRETPKDILDLMYEISLKLDSLGWTLRSGGADGADTAFEKGAKKPDIYLPWKGFNNRQGIILEHCDRENFAYDLASKIHPAWDKLSRGASALHARNIFQVLGHLDSMPKSKFLICYAKPSGDSVSGGTRTAVECAKMHDVKVENLFHEDVQEKMHNFIS